MTMIIGIETSCDETAIALVRRVGGGAVEVLGQELASQIHLHNKYGGVVPEIASRNHLDIIGVLYQRLLGRTGVPEAAIDAVSVTAGPGLIGGLLVGVMFAKGLALKLGKPIIGVNHLEGHALIAGLTDGVEPPFVLLLVSGGHCQIIKVEALGQYEILGKTRDDSVGEAFDKVSKMMGLGYPGGPIIEQRARFGDPYAVALPVPLLRDSPYDFSFSGLKTAVKRHLDGITLPLTDEVVSNVSASFQRVVGDVLSNRLQNVMRDFALMNGPEDGKSPGATGRYKLVISGGVAANQYLLGRIREATREYYVDVENNVVAPPIGLCTDNGIMIAWAGLQHYEAGRSDPLSLEPRSRWPLSALATK